jgi:hypothetical protein
MTEDLVPYTEKENGNNVSVSKNHITGTKRGLSTQKFSSSSSSSSSSVKKQKKLASPNQKYPPHPILVRQKQPQSLLRSVPKKCPHPALLLPLLLWVVK